MDHGASTGQGWPGHGLFHSIGIGLARTRTFHIRIGLARTRTFHIGNRNRASQDMDIPYRNRAGQDIYRKRAVHLQQGGSIYRKYRLPVAACVYVDSFKDLTEEIHKAKLARISTLSQQ